MRKALLVAVVVMGCGPAPLPGAPTLGSSCVASAEPECITAASVGYCESGKWVEYACPSECRNAQSPRCDWGLSAPGDACPAAKEGAAFCGTSMRAIRCISGKYVAEECPTACKTINVSATETKSSCY